MSVPNPWEEVPRPPVRGICKRCQPLIIYPVRGADVVSPTGLAHIGQDGGVTACGIDATGDRWWWPL